MQWEIQHSSNAMRNSVQFKFHVLFSVNQIPCKFNTILIHVQFCCIYTMRNSVCWNQSISEYLNTEQGWKCIILYTCYIIWKRRQKLIHRLTTSSNWKKACINTFTSHSIWKRPAWNTFTSHRLTIYQTVKWNLICMWLFWYVNNIKTSFILHVNKPSESRYRTWQWSFRLNSLRYR
jgi:hypothetical protein